MSSIRVVMGLAASLDLEIEQLDVKLHSYMEILFSLEVLLLSLFYDPFAHRIYDYSNGIRDLTAMKLKTVVPAHLSFEEDCARILRGIRIAARLGFSFKKDTEKANCRLYASVTTNYVVPLDKSSSSLCITRPLAEILRDLNKCNSDNILRPRSKIIPWFHANRMLNFYAPGWCGEVRDVSFSDGSITVVYRVTIRGSDAEAVKLPEQ